MNAKRKTNKKNRIYISPTDLYWTIIKFNQELQNTMDRVNQEMLSDIRQGQIKKIESRFTLTLIEFINLNLN